MPPRKKVVRAAPATEETLAATTIRLTRNSTRARTAASAAAAASHTITTTQSYKEASDLSADDSTEPTTPSATNKKGGTKKAVAPVAKKRNPRKPAQKKSSASTHEEVSKSTFPVVTQISSPPTEPESTTTSGRQIAPTKKSTQAKTPIAIEQGLTKMGPTSRNKRHREEEVLITVSKNGGFEMSPSKPKKARTKDTTTTKKLKIDSIYSETTCKKWFEKYADPGNPTVMLITGAHDWLQDLGVHMESSVYFVLAWFLDVKAMFSITREEFLVGMRAKGIDCNEKLLHQLPTILSSVYPSHSSPEFKKFYKFCFDYMKAGCQPGAKNVDLETAVEFLNMALDKNRFSITYRPLQEESQEATGGTNEAIRQGDGDFPHMYAFVHFLKTKSPVKVMNRDQWESFVPFNKSVGWDLEGYSEDGAWPSLFDQYIEWKKGLSTLKPATQ